MPRVAPEVRCPSRLCVIGLPAACPVAHAELCGPASFAFQLQPAALAPFPRLHFAPPPAAFSLAAFFPEAFCPSCILPRLHSAPAAFPWLYSASLHMQDEYDAAYEYPKFLLQQRVADVMLNVSFGGSTLGTTALSHRCHASLAPALCLAAHGSVNARAWASCNSRSTRNLECAHMRAQNTETCMHTCKHVHTHARTHLNVGARGTDVRVSRGKPLCPAHSRTHRRTRICKRTHPYIRTHSNVRRCLWR